MRQLQLAYLRSSLIAIATIMLGACGGNGGGDEVAPKSPDLSEAFNAQVRIQGNGHITSLSSPFDCFESFCSVRTEAPLEVLAVPASGYRLIEWSDPKCGVGQTCKLDATPLTVTFQKLPPEVPNGSWIGGDLHVHTDHSSDGSLPRQTFGDAARGNVSVADQLGEATRMGLDFLSLTDHRTYDQHYDPLWDSASLLLVPGEEANGRPHSTVHGAVDMLTQASVQNDKGELARLQQSIWDAHSQNAVWISAHPEKDLMHDDGTLKVLADAVGVDLVEAWNNAKKPDVAIDYSEDRWNAGYRFGVAGASDNHFREVWLTHGPGKPTTRTFVEKPSQRALLQALKQGRTHVGHRTDGPFVTFEADFEHQGFTAMAGDEVVVPAGSKGMLRIRLEGAQGQRVLVYRSPGRSAGPIAEFRPKDAFEVHTLPVESRGESEWFRVEILSLLGQLRGLSSPIFVSETRAHPQVDWLPEETNGTDGARWVFGTLGSYSGFADAARSGSRLHIVAETHSSTGSKIVYKHITETNAIQPKVISGADEGARFARVAAEGERVVAVWQDSYSQTPLRTRIRMNQSEDGGKTWGRPVTIRQVEGRSEHPVLVLGSGGDPLVAWQEIQAGGAYDVWFVDFAISSEPENISEAGKIIVHPHSRDSRSARYPASLWPSLAVSGSGEIAIAWHDNRTDPDPLWTGSAGLGEGTAPDNWQIMVKRRGVEGKWGEPLSVGMDEEADQHPSLAFDNEQRLILAWNRKPLKSSGASWSLGVAHIEGDALTLLSAGHDHEGHQQRPRLARSDKGVMQMVWYEGGSDDWRWKISQSMLEDGRWSEAQRLNAPGNNSWPVTTGDEIVFTSSRYANALQRDPTHMILTVTNPK